MNPDDALLKEKALLLLSKEREVLILRKHLARVSGWLTITQSLPEIISAGNTQETFFTELSKKLIEILQLQKVLLFEVTPEKQLVSVLRRRAKAPATLTPAAAQLLEREPVGLCNSPDRESLRDLADIVGLERFMWHGLQSNDPGTPLLIAAGYDPGKASFYEPFEDDDFIHFKNMGQHLSALLENASLVKALEKEKEILQRFNENLETRVRERAEELAKANDELARTLGSLQEKDRRLREDLEQASAFQQTILPLVPKSWRIAFAASYRPLELVGGDIYDVSRLSDTHFRCFMADATGHGVQASLRTIALKSEYDRVKGTAEGPNQVLKELNRRLTAQYASEEMLCTACCFDLLLTSEGASLRYANCAQPPLLRFSGEKVDEIYCPGPFVGLLNDIEVSVVEAPLCRGDLVLAYSDGLCEQSSVEGKVFEPRTRLSNGAELDVTADHFLDRVMDQLSTFRGSTPQSDDVTLLAARVL